MNDTKLSREDAINALELRLMKALPLEEDDGTFGTDGSYEELMDVFERAFDVANDVALQAIKMLREPAPTEGEG